MGGNTDEFGLATPKRDLDDLPQEVWRRKATDWIYTLRERTHGLNNLIQSLAGEVSAMRGDLDVALESLKSMDASMKEAKDSALRVESVVSFLKWALPVSVAMSGVLVAVITVATRK